MNTLNSINELKNIIQSGELSILFKKSPICPVSHSAEREVQQFLNEATHISSYVVDVISQRPLSQEIEKEIGVRHESPQVFIFKSGKIQWKGSHYKIKANELLKQIA
jgi:bacillithiol system protein YtxJ